MDPVEARRSQLPCIRCDKLTVHRFMCQCGEPHAICVDCRMDAEQLECTYILQDKMAHLIAKAKEE